MPGDFGTVGRRLFALAWLVVMALLCSACVTTAEFRKLERHVLDKQRGKGGAAAGWTRTKSA